MRPACGRCEIPYIQSRIIQFRMGIQSKRCALVAAITPTIRTFPLRKAVETVAVGPLIIEPVADHEPVNGSYKYAPGTSTLLTLGVALRDSLMRLLVNLWLSTAT